MQRKKFIGLSLALTGIAGFVASCTSKKRIKGNIIGASASVGHQLRDKKFATATEAINKKVVIVGGGVSGLSAAWNLHRQDVTDFVLLDLEKQPGGNAASGHNDISAYPWGAHYVPVPNNALTEYLGFLQECNVITAFNDKGLPVYNEYYLCFDPEERLYINGRWQDGLVPHFGVPAGELKQIERFLQLMDEYRHQKGSDGKDAFAIPVDQSSKDGVFTSLDKITMKAWLTNMGLTSQYLHWYVNYCTRDDFGTPHHIASAWSGIHYFAARKGAGANASHADVLTWPEGNGFLVQQLQKDISKNIQTGCLAVSIQSINDRVRVEYLDTATNTIKAIEAEQCITAVPQFIAARLLRDEERMKKVHAHFNYVPWMVANIKAKKMEERSGAPLSWDNVLYGSESLGYVMATHQLIKQSLPVQNLTYYYPLTTSDTINDRKQAMQRTHEEWTEIIINDLQKIYPTIRTAAEEINIMLWGHAMVQTTPGMAHGTIRQELAASIANNIHFAHTDLAGISIFEEAFYQGLQASKKAIAAMA